MLGELTGSPAYYAPLDLSPAVDVAVAEYCLETDQLGTPRPQGGGCDIGAIESTTAQPAQIEAQPFCPPAPTRSSPPTPINPTGAAKPAMAPILSISLEISPISENLQPITSDITIEGNGYTISGDGRFRIFDVDGGMLTVKNLTMTEGRGGSGGGGAIRLQNGGRALVSNSRFVKNYAESGRRHQHPLENAQFLDDHRQ